MEYQTILSIVLTDNISFEDITNKIAFAFKLLSIYKSLLISIGCLSLEIEFESITLSFV